MTKLSLLCVFVLLLAHGLHPTIGSHERRAQILSDALVENSVTGMYEGSLPENDKLDALRNYAEARIVDLIDKEVNVNDPTPNEWTPLHEAARYGRTDRAKAILDGGVNAVDDVKWTPLHYAARFGHTEIVRALLARGANVDAQNIYGRTPLYLASYGGHSQIATGLVFAGASKSIAADNGKIPLDVVCESSDVNCCGITRSYLVELLKTDTTPST